MSETQMENQRQSEELTIEKMLHKEHLLAASQAVKANAGAPGIDGMTVERLGPHLREHWPRIAAKLREGRYRPSAVRAVDIPKPHGCVAFLQMRQIRRFLEFFRDAPPRANSNWRGPMYANWDGRLITAPSLFAVLTASIWIDKRGDDRLRL